MVGLGLKLEDLVKQKGLENKEKTQFKSFGELVDKEKMVSQKSDEPMAIDNPVSTKTELANFANTSYDTVSKVKEIKKDMPTEVKKEIEDKLSSGDLSINQAHKVVKLIKNNDNAGEILKMAIEKTEASPKQSLENAVKEAKYEIGLDEKENNMIHFIVLSFSISLQIISS
jgi:hypothetical protein